MININPKYSEPVGEFVFVDPRDKALPESRIPLEQLNALVDEVAEKIFDISHTRQVLQLMSTGHVTLLDAAYLAIEGVDKKDSLDTPTKIKEATFEEKTILAHVVKKLILEIPRQFKTDDLNALTLLFGIHQINRLAAGDKLIPFQSIPEKDKIKEILTQLKAMKSQCDTIPINRQSPGLQNFLQKVDAEIAFYSDHLADLTH